MFIAVEEWWNADDHLVDENAERPPIYGVIVTVTDQHLWGEILSGTAERVSDFTLLDKFSKTKVRKHQVSVLANKYILRLEIPIQNLLGVKLRKTQGYLSGKKLCLLFVESLDLD